MNRQMQRALGSAILASTLVLPVAAVTIALGDRLFGFPHLILAVVVLFFSLGPNDIGRGVVASEIEPRPDILIADQELLFVLRGLGDEAEISSDASRVRVLAVPTNEEKTIARDVIRVLNGIMPEFTPPETVT